MLSRNKKCSKYSVIVSGFYFSSTPDGQRVRQRRRTEQYISVGRIANWQRMHAKPSRTHFGRTIFMNFHSRLILAALQPRLGPDSRFGRVNLLVQFSTNSDVGLVLIVIKLHISFLIICLSCPPVPPTMLLAERKTLEKCAAAVSDTIGMCVSISSLGSAGETIEKVHDQMEPECDCQLRR